MYTVEATYNQILSLFVGFEQEQPFRHQPNVLVTVDFQEYIDFVVSMVKAEMFCLSLTPTYYVKAVKNISQTAPLLKAFYYDMSYVVLYEAIMSHRLLLDSTIIGMTFNNVQDAQEVYLDNAYALATKLKKFSDGLSSIRENISQAGTGSSNSLSKLNQQIVEYAVLLRTLSYESNPIAYEIKVRR